VSVEKIATFCLAYFFTDDAAARELTDYRGFLSQEVFTSQCFVMLSVQTVLDRMPHIWLP